MIETTLGACIDAEPCLSRLAAQAWPVKTAYHLAKLTRLVRVEVAAFEEQRSVLVQKFGAARPPTEAERARGAADEVFEVGADNLTAYLQQFRELRSASATIAWQPLTLTELDDAGVSVMGTDLIGLGPFLDGEG